MQLITTNNPENRAVLGQFNYYQLQAIINKHEAKLNQIQIDSNVALLCRSNLDYAIWALTLMNLGVDFLNCSPSNPTKTIFGLLKRAKIRILVYDEENEQKAREISSMMNVRLIKRFKADLSKLETKQIKPMIFKSNVFFHSSGSTSTPKLILHSAKYYKTNVKRLNKRLKIKGSVKIEAPLNHAFGFKILLCALQAGATITFDSNASTLFSLPYLLESNDELEKYDNIYFSGASLSQACRDKIIKKNIELKGIYGSSETGYIATINLNQGNHLEFDEELEIKLQPNGSYFDVCVEAESSSLSGSISVQNGLYFTSDLVCKEAGKYRLMGRKDDLLLHVNGEKTNALAVEEQINRDELVQNSCIVNKVESLFYVVILQLNRQAYELPAKKLLGHLSELFAKINLNLPAHSAIVNELVFVLPLGYDKKLQTTDKGNIRRNMNKQMFEREINDMYKNYE